MVSSHPTMKSTRRLAGQQQEKDTKDHPADIEVRTQSTLANARIRTKLCPKRADATENEKGKGSRLLHEAVEMVAQQRQKAATLVPYVSKGENMAMSQLQLNSPTRK
jgi:hypothetical protein